MKIFIFTILILIQSTLCAQTKALKVPSEITLLAQNEVTYKINAKQYEDLLKSGKFEEIKKFVIQEHLNYIKNYFSILTTKNTLLINTTDFSRFYGEYSAKMRSEIKTIADITEKTSLESESVIFKKITEFLQNAIKAKGPEEIQFSLKFSKLIFFLFSNIQEIKIVAAEIKNDPELLSKIKLIVNKDQLKNPDDSNAKMHFLEIAVYTLAGVSVFLLASLIALFVQVKKLS